MMPEQGLRPDVATFECAGCRVALVDAAGILAAAEAGRVELLHGAAFPAPVRRVRIWVVGGVRDGTPVHVLGAEIATGPGGPGHEDLSTAVLGLTGPVGVLLARRAAAGDKLAVRIADGVGLAAERLGLGRVGGGDNPAGDAGAGDAAVVREVEAAGLRATVSQAAVPAPPGSASGRITTLDAAVPSASVSAAHLQ